MAHQPRRSAPVELKMNDTRPCISMHGYNDVYATQDTT